MPDADTDTKGVSLLVAMPPDLGAALRDRARADDRSMSAVVRVALRRYLGLAEDNTEGNEL